MEAGEASGACDAGLVRAFELLGKRWNGLILSVLQSGPMKFSDLRRGVGQITDSMLADRLVELVQEGLVDRTTTGERPVRVSYALTARAVNLQPILEQLAGWASDNLPTEADRARVGRLLSEVR